MEVDGKTKLLSLVGMPVAHSLSPRLHNAAIRLLKRNELYVPMEAKLESVNDAKLFLEWCWNIGVVGLNVTLPYKELFAKALLSSLPSINTVYRGLKGWMATSTDGEGFYNAINRISSYRHFDRAVILGNGGASLAIVEYLLRCNLIDRIEVLRRSGEKDESWRTRLALNPATFDFYPMTPEIFGKRIAHGGTTLVIQTTSAPLKGDNLEDFADQLNFFEGVLIDIVYGHPSALWHRARYLGIPVQDGLPMLIEQARCSQKLWWGDAATYDILEKSLN